MFCMKCGKQLEDNVSFCSNCGASQNPGIKPRKKVKPKLLVAILASAALIVLLAIILVTLPMRNINTSPENLAVAVVESMFEVDAKKMLQCMPDFWVRENAYIYNLDRDASRREVLKAMRAYENDANKVDIKVLSVMVTDTVDLNDLRDEIDYYGITYEEFEQITQAVYVEVDIMAVEEGYTDMYEIFCIQMNGKWYMLDFD